MFRVFVFPSCNEPGLEVINSLVRSNKITLYGGSSYDVEYDPSRLILRNYIKCPDYYDKNFGKEFRKILDDYQIDIMFPSVDILVAEFSKWRLRNTIFLTTNSETAELFLSKSRTYERLKEVVPVPRLYSASDVEFPAYAKPDSGSGSRGSMLVNSIEELQLAIKKDLLICEFLPGNEFTVDCINDLEGNLLFSNVRIRGRIGRGISLGARDVSYPQIDNYVRRIADEVRIEGPWFAQFKVGRDGQPKLMEVNARVAGSMTFTRLSGVNIPLMSVFLFRGYEVEVPRARNGVLLNRCLKNLGETHDFKWVLWDLDDTILRKDGKPDPDVIACLYDYNNRHIRQILITKNPEVERLLKVYKIPDFFVEVRLTEEKMAEMESIMRIHNIEAKNCVIVNDSYTENLAMQKRFPEIRTLTPDSLDLLGREKVS